MFKVLIADDEPKIRNGIRDSIDWSTLNMAIIGLAADGEEALAIAEKEKPDICLIDICMPFLDGLELIETLSKQNPKIVNIIITGHDEFDYAQKAVKLNVFDYILKPVSEDELFKVVQSAAIKLEELINKENRYELANIQLKKSLPFLREKFVNDWINGKLTLEEINEQLSFHDTILEHNVGIILLKTQGVAISAKSEIEWERQLLLFAIRNIFEEMLEPFAPFVDAMDSSENLVALVTINDINMWEDLKFSIQNNIEKYLDHRVIVYSKTISGSLEEAGAVYEEIIRTMRSDTYCLPIIKKIKELIEKNYMDHELSLQWVADKTGLSISHLSKLFKQETGTTFIDYLIKIRIMEALRLMKNSDLKIYEVAEQVGYSGQHYFCAAFKKIVGLSPNMYKQNKHLKTNSKKQGDI